MTDFLWVRPQRPIFKKTFDRIVLGFGQCFFQGQNSPKMKPFVKHIKGKGIFRTTQTDFGSGHVFLKILELPMLIIQLDVLYSAKQVSTYFLHLTI